MSKLLTQAEISYAVGNITMATDDDGALTSLIDLAHHIDALASELKSTESRLHEVATACANAEGRLKSLFERVSGETVGSYPEHYIEWLGDMIEGELDASEGALHKAQSELKRRDALEAEPVGEVIDVGGVMLVEWKACLQEGSQLYAAAPAPAVPDEQSWDELCRINPEMTIGDAIIRSASWNACRAAMLANMPVSGAILDVIAERQRQITAEGWTPEHDDKHSVGEMAMAASCYAIGGQYGKGVIPMGWPWYKKWWKPSSERRNLVKAGALILAEIERLDRANKEQK